MLRLARHWMQISSTSTLFVSYFAHGDWNNCERTVFPLDPRPYKKRTTKANLGLTGNLLIILLTINTQHDTSIDLIIKSTVHSTTYNIIIPAALRIAIPPQDWCSNQDDMDQYLLRPKGDRPKTTAHTIVTFYETTDPSPNPDLPLFTTAVKMPDALLHQISPPDVPTIRDTLKRALSEDLSEDSNSSCEDGRLEGPIDLRYHDIPMDTVKHPKPPLGLIRLLVAHSKDPVEGLNMSNVDSIRNWYHSYATRGSPNLRNLMCERA